MAGNLWVMKVGGGGSGGVGEQRESSIPTQTLPFTT